MSGETKRDVAYLVLGLLVVGATLWYYSSLGGNEIRLIQFTMYGLLLLGILLYRVIKRR